MADYILSSKRNVFRFFSLTNWMIIINIFVFILTAILSTIYGQEKVFSWLALQPNLFFSGKIWILFTSIFMHGSVAHLVFNMISLFFIGNFIEKIIGRKRFLIFYIISGIFAGLFFAILSYYFGNICILNFGFGCIGEKIFFNPATPAVGASGAIFALLGLLAILTPKNRVYLIVGPLIAIILEAVFSSLFPNSNLISILNLIVTIYFFLAIFSMFAPSPRLRKISIPIEMSFWLLPIIAIVPLIIIGLFIELPIGNTAHLGGLIAGIIYAIYLKKRYKRKTDMISKIFSR